MNLPRHPQPTFLCFSHHVRFRPNVSFEPYWSACSEPCSPLFNWFLDFTTLWCASSKIHQNLALQVGFLLSSNEQILTTIRWFYAHWTIQLLIAGPIIFTGWSYGHQTASLLETGHFVDTHQKIGLSLLILYVLQLTIGAFVHFFKFSTIFRGHRPPHSYFHIFFGLAIVILAQYQVCLAPK